MCLGLATDIERLVMRSTLNKLIDLGVDYGSKALSGWLGGGTITGPSTKGTPVTGGPATYDTAGWNAWLATNAHGNVVPFARGGIVDRPTVFPFARGMGLMGEAGPEGILPLRRTPRGDLGVMTAGGPAVVNNVQVINNHPGAQVSQEEQKNDQGGVNLTVVIDAVEQAMAQRAARPGTVLNRSLAAASNPIRSR